MTPTPKTPGWFLFTRHWVSLLGVALIVTAAISSLFVVPSETRGHAENPYLGIVLIVVLPAVLFLGLGNVFPDLKVTWGTYPNNLGHTDFLGCFRCHDGSHTAADGKTISQDCNSCHEPLAMEEPAPEILKTLGIAEKLSKVQRQ